MIRIESGLSEFLNRIHVYQFSKFFIINNFNFLNFMRSSETVKKMKERNTRFNCRKMRNCSDVHNFLNASCTEHCKTCLSCGINVSVISENRKSMRRKSTSRNMKNAWKKFSRDFIHVRNHQKKTLRSRICGSQSSGLKGTVNSSRRSSFRLHFNNLYRFAENIFLSFCRPFISIFCHI